MIAAVVTVVVPSRGFGRFPVISVVVLSNGLHTVRGKFVVYFCRWPGFCPLVQTEVFLGVFSLSPGPVRVIIQSWFSADTFVESEVRECWRFRFAVSTKAGISLANILLPALAVAGVYGGVPDLHHWFPRQPVRSNLSSSRGYGDIDLLWIVTTTSTTTGAGRGGEGGGVREFMISDVCWLIFSLGGGGKLPNLLSVLPDLPLLLETLTPPEVNSGFCSFSLTGPAVAS